MADVLFQGGCLCGEIRFASSDAPVDAGYCHCTLCRRSTGAPVLAWASFPASGFRYLEGEPARFRSSESGRREFCRVCGTQIAFRGDEGGTVDVNLGSLDAPEAIQPRRHLFTSNRLRWFDTRDALPRHPEGGPPPLLA